MHILHTVLYTFLEVLTGEGEFVYQSKAYFVCDHFLYSCEFNVGLRGDIGRNEMLVTLTV